eukprot:gene23638-9167_t
MMAEQLAASQVLGEVQSAVEAVLGSFGALGAEPGVVDAGQKATMQALARRAHPVGCPTGRQEVLRSPTNPTLYPPAAPGGVGGDVLNNESSTLGDSLSKCKAVAMSTKQPPHEVDLAHSLSGSVTLLAASGASVASPRQEADMFDPAGRWSATVSAKGIGGRGAADGFGSLPGGSSPKEWRKYWPGKCAGCIQHCGIQAAAVSSTAVSNSRLL